MPGVVGSNRAGATKISRKRQPQEQASTPGSVDTAAGRKAGPDEVPSPAAADGTLVSERAAPRGANAPGDDVAMAAAWGDDARRLLQCGEIARATAEAMRAVTVLRTAGAPEPLSVALAVAAEAQAEAGNLDPALQLATESVAIAQASGDGRTLARACRALGELHGILGQFSESARLLGQALKASAPADDGAAHAHILDALCRNALRLADRARQAGATPAAELRDDAIEHGRRSLEAARQARDPRAEAACGASLALALLRRGDIDRALPFLHDAGALAATHGLCLLQHRIAAIEGEALLARGETAEAVRRLRGLATACERMGVPLIEIDARLALYRGAKAEDDFEQALAAHERYHQLDAQIRTDVAQARAHVLINEVETQNARLEAEKARLEAELLRTQEPPAGIREARTPGAGPRARPARAPGRPHRPVEPALHRRRTAAPAGACGRERSRRWRWRSATSTCSRRSTTATGTRPATSCSAPSPICCATIAALPTPWPAWAARNSCWCWRTPI